MVRVCLESCSVFLFYAPERHRKSLRTFIVDEIVNEKYYHQSMKTLLEDWEDASLLSTVLWT